MKQKLIFEVVWILITVILVIIMVLPIYQNIGYTFPYYFQNIAMIIIAVTFGRILFFIKHHWFYPSKAVLIVLIFVPIPIFLFLVDTQYEFQRFLDEEGIMSIMKHLPGKDQMVWSKFIKTEMILFLAAAYVSTISIPFRMLYALSKIFRK